MDDALLKQLLRGEEVVDIWNHRHSNAVTIVYQQGGKRQRVLIAIKQAENPGTYRAASPVYLIDDKATWWKAESHFPEEAVCAVWMSARTVLLTALQHGTALNPEFIENPDQLNGPHDLVWPDPIFR